MISASHLSRNPAAALDAVEIEHETLLVTRARRPVAILAPFSSTDRRDGQRPIVAVLSPIQRDILLKVAGRAPQATGSFEEFGSYRETAPALNGLEDDGFLAREFGGLFSITEQGILVAAVLQARETSDAELSGSGT